MEYRSKNRCSDGQSSEASNKRFKTQNNQENSSPRPPSPSPSPSPSQSESILSFIKGKSKLEPEAESCVCGICLKEAVDDGNNVYRGYIDSCDHYFCFVCIMEWAKIESKCPLCRCRFTTIRRPPMPPLVPCERLIRVPVRDQANYNSAGPIDSYHDVECTVCHSSADENLLLLCDLCDAASHTYCVGLSHAVPEGDWFCQDCTLLRDEHRQSKSDAESEELRNSENAHSSSEVITVSDITRPPESPLRRLERSSEYHAQSKLTIESSELSDSGNANSSPEDITVFDIVRGPESPIRRIGRSSIHFQNELDIESDDLIHSGNSSSSARNITALDIVRDPESPIRRAVRSPASNLSGERIGIDKKGQANNVQDSSRLSARTLQQKRNVLDRIQALRDNWNCLRSGSLNFSSSSSSCSNQIHEVANNSAQPQSASSTSERLSSETCLPFVIENRIVHEIDKAWKMMTMAKTLEQKRGGKGILNKASKNPLNSKLPLTKDQPSLSVNPARTRQESLSPLHTLVNKSNKLRTQIFEKRSLSMQRPQNCRIGFPVSSSPPVRFVSPQNTSSPCQSDIFGRNARNLPKKTEEATVLSASSDHCSLSSSVGSASVASNLSHTKLELPASSSCKIEVSKFKDKSAKEKDPTDLKKPETNDPKSEIQSLVKLNLKLLTKDKQLGVNAFKEVAWKSTHSILAACGMEQPKPGIRIFPSCTCRHVNNGSLDIRRSTLMPYSCRECFYVFVKDVVNTIMAEKIEVADVQ